MRPTNSNKFTSMPSEGVNAAIFLSFSQHDSEGPTLTPPWVLAAAAPVRRLACPQCSCRAFCQDFFITNRNSNWEIVVFSSPRIGPDRLYYTTVHLVPVLQDGPWPQKKRRKGTKTTELIFAPFILIVGSCLHIILWWFNRNICWHVFQKLHVRKSAMTTQLVVCKDSRFNIIFQKQSVERSWQPK